MNINKESGVTVWNKKKHKPKPKYRSSEVDSFPEEVNHTPTLIVCAIILVVAILIFTYMF